MILLILESIIPVLGLMTLVTFAMGMVLDFAIRLTDDQCPGERNGQLMTPRSQAPN